MRSAVVSQPKGTTSTGMRVVAPSPGTTLRSSAMITSRALEAATIFSRSSAPPRPFTRSSVPSAISSAPSIVRSMWRCVAKSVIGIPPASAWARLRSEVGIARMSSFSSRTRRISPSIAK